MLKIEIKLKPNTNLKMDYLTSLKEKKIELSDVPPEIITEEMCRIAVEDCGYNLEDVPEEFKTEEICRIAVESYGCALSDVPVSLRTEEICRIAIENDEYAFLYTPHEVRTEEICLLALQFKGELLEYILEEKITEEMCVTAVTQCGWAIEYVPDKFITKEIVNIATNYDKDLIPYIKSRLKKIRDDFESNLHIIPENISLNDLEDPVTLEPPIQGGIYALIQTGDTWKIGISLKDAQRFRRERFRGSNEEKIFVPLVNELRDISLLRWTRF